MIKAGATLSLAGFVCLSLLVLLIAGCGGSKSSEDARAQEWRTEVRLTLLELRDAGAAFASTTAKGLPGLRDQRRSKAFQRALTTYYPCGRRLRDVTPPLARLRQGIALMMRACRAFSQASERGSKGDFARARSASRKGLALLDRAELRLRLRPCRGCDPEDLLWSL